MIKAKQLSAGCVEFHAAWVLALCLGAGQLLGQSAPAANSSTPAASSPASSATSTVTSGGSAAAPAATAPVTAPAELPGAIALPPRPGEMAVEGLTRRDANTVTLALGGGRELLLHDFQWDGQAVRTSQLHLKQLAPGVVEITSLAAMVGDWRFHVRDAANYYGLGERADALNHAHTLVKNAMVASAGAVGGSSEKPMPFYMSTSGYGLWVDATSEATFDMNASDAGEVTVTAPAARLRVVLFPGPGFAGILERFTRIMGPALLPPYWAFAPWQVMGQGGTQAQVLEDVERLRELKLPASVILADDPWVSGTYGFDAQRFTDAAAMAKRVHDAGFKLVAGVSPWVERPHPDPAEGFADDPYFVRSRNGGAYVRAAVRPSSAVDLSGGLGRGWWQDQLRAAVKLGVDGFALGDTAGGFPAEAKFADATDPRLMANRYAMLAAAAAEELIDKDLKSDGVLLQASATQGARGAGFLLADRHRASFSPEAGLPTLVNAALSAGLSGMPLWAGEMGTGKADDAVFSRWAEFACFSPVMISTTRPWEFGEAAFDVYRRYATLQMSLFPYRYAAAVEAAKTGMPVMRALVLSYQDDERARTAKDEYMFGPDLLVAPVLDESTARLVYLPAGTWMNYWTGAQVEGGRTIMADAPLDTVPVYARMGAVIPKLLDQVQTLVTGAESGGAAAGSLDGRRLYELEGAAGDGETAMTDFEGRKLVRKGATLTLSGGPAARVFVRWRFAPVSSVTVNGAAVNLQTGDGGPFVEFDYSGDASVSWQ